MRPSPASLTLHPERQTPTWLLFTSMLLVAGPLIAVSQIAAHLRFDVVDDQLFGFFGWRIAHGAALYRDVWDNKPPGIFWINALGFWISGDRYAGVVALCVVALLATHVLFYLVCANLYFRGAAALTTVLASFYYTHGYFQGGTNRTETFLIPFELAGVLLYFRGFVRDRWWCWLGAGVACGCAFLFKQVGLAAWGAMGVHLLFLAAMRELALRVVLTRGILLTLGAAIPVGVTTWIFIRQGTLDEAIFAIFRFNRYYFQFGSTDLYDTFVNRHLLWNHIEGRLTLPVLMAIAAGIHATLWYLRPARRPPELEKPLREFGPACPHPMLLFGVLFMGLFVALWWAVAFYGATVSPHAFRHYLLPTFTPLLLMAGYLVNVLHTEARLLDRLQQRAWVVAAFVLMGYLALDSAWDHLGEVSRVWLNRFERKKQAPWEDVADEARRWTKPGDTLQCFSYMPGVYLHARLENASRFATTEKIGQLGDLVEYQQRELHDVLDAHPPVMFVLPSGYVAASDPPPDRLQPWMHRWLLELLETRYAKVAEVSADDDNVYLYLRKDRVPKTPTTTQPR